MKLSIATQLVDLMWQDGVELYVNEQGVGYATLVAPHDLTGAGDQNGTHREHWPIDSGAFRRHLQARYYEVTHRAANGQAVKDAIGALEGKAQASRTIVPVHTRVAAHDGRLYLDLADTSWSVVEITATGWDITTNAPVRFRRPRGLEPLRRPVYGGDLEVLRDFINVDDDDWKLTASWLVSCLRPDYPFAPLALFGEQGTAKSTKSLMLRQLVDPNTTGLRANPRDERDLIIAATNGWLVCFDNVSRVPDWLSDAFCRLATGGGFGTRKLFTDGEEALFYVKRPLLLNGIEDFVRRGDLADRAISMTLPVIRETARRTEADLWTAYNEARPGILGGLLDAAVVALLNVGTVVLEKLPRMADFATWAVAAAPAFGWTGDDFLAVYAENRGQRSRVALESEVVGVALYRLVQQHKKVGPCSATALLNMLNEAVPESERPRARWPESPTALGSALRRVAPQLRDMGVIVEYGKKSTGRLVSLEIGTTTKGANTGNGHLGDGAGTPEPQRCPGETAANSTPGTPWTPETPFDPLSASSDRARLEAEAAAGDQLAIDVLAALDTGRT